MSSDPAFLRWFFELEKRHLAHLSFAEVRRALQALSVLYVEKRGSRLEQTSGLDSAGKRAAFALFYGPLHFLAVRQVVRTVGWNGGRLQKLVDLGCGTGSAGLAWSLELEEPPLLLSYDSSSWAVEETRWSCEHFDLTCRGRRLDILRAPLPGRGGGVIAAYTVNELADSSRLRLLRSFRQAAERGAVLLIVEPISRRLTAWMEAWAEELADFSPRLQDHRFRLSLPPRLQLLDKAAGLDHSEITCRSLQAGDFSSAT